MSLLQYKCIEIKGVLPFANFPPLTTGIEMHAAVTFSLLQELKEG